MEGSGCQVKLVQPCLSRFHLTGPPNPLESEKSLRVTWYITHHYWYSLCSARLSPSLESAIAPVAALQPQEPAVPGDAGRVPRELKGLHCLVRT